MLSYKEFNEMTEKELCKLEGIGTLVAKRILANRPFRSDKDLLKIKGLGKTTLEKLGIEFKKRKSRDKTLYFMNGEPVDVSTQAYAIDKTNNQVDYFWRIPPEHRQYLG
ncbi:MAG: helix-hairpin-helix domain-containing protein [Proteobacteria bacterium]|nr:helix-hairpin-helix domain-containing protein [Pseudomonadota bacterium]NBP16539.1 helix-hairpin-helix domain-containing protein [bacterium]